jgi:hypothetical protein
MSESKVCVGCGGDLPERPLFVSSMPETPLCADCSVRLSDSHGDCTLEEESTKLMIEALEFMADAQSNCGDHPVQRRKNARCKELARLLKEAN